MLVGTLKVLNVEEPPVEPASNNNIRRGVPTGLLFGLNHISNGPVAETRMFVA